MKETKMIKSLLNRKKSIAIVGLGYVGLPLAVELSKVFNVIGFDIKRQRIEELSSGIDINREFSKKELSRSIRTKIEFTDNPTRLKDASIIIVAVPTPIDEDKIPDLSPLKRASEIVGRNLRKGAVVVYESTVYPGVTEEICVPIIEKTSGMKCGRDFKAGYSPERINPGDKSHGLSNIVKVVAGQDKETTEILAKVYGSVVKAGIYKAPDIKTAEAAKVIENIQRDLNIALMNELAIIFNRIGLDTKEVLKSAGTKWNFYPFEPGLVGGHCIGVDPYYLTFKAEAIGYHPQVTLSGRRINDSMGKYIAENTVKQLINSNHPIRGSKVLILGFTFKENISDIRNTRVIDIYNYLRDYGIKVFVHDPHAIPEDVLETYGLFLIQRPEDKKPFNGIVLAVKHKEYCNYTLKYLKKLCSSKPVLIDIKSIFNKKSATRIGFNYWGL